MKKYSCHNQPLARMHFKLAWSILGTRRFNFIQMKSLGSQMAPSPERGQKGGMFLKSSKPVDQMQKYLAWSILMTCRYKIV